MEDFTQFSPKALTFLRSLARNNRREWFQEHKGEYEEYLRHPMSLFIEEMDVRLADIAPEIIGSTKKSAFRIYRDVRFSKDKSPYKTHAACWFYHRDGGSGVGSEATHGGAGFYFQLSPRGCFCGAGIWMPPRPTLHRIRVAMVEDQSGWERIVLDRSFRRRFGDLDETGMLKRLPRGYAPDHPAGRWLRYTSLFVNRDVSMEDATSRRLPQVLAGHFQAATPMVRWINAATGLREASLR